MSKRIYLIPDTNVLMQCRNLIELPWKDEFPEFESIVVVLVTPVMREVDRHKGGQGRLAKRARVINSLIGELLETPMVDLSKKDCLPSVKMISEDKFRPDPELQPSLDYAQADDAIVGTVSAIGKAYVGERVELLSNDNGVLLSARRMGVPFHRVPPDWLLPAESDEDQKKFKALEGEVKRLRSSEPVCVIESKGLPWIFNVESFGPLSDPQIQKLLQALQQQFPEETNFGPRGSSTRSAAPGLHGIFAHFGQEEFVPATDSEILYYQQESYPQWVTNCADYLRVLHHKLEQHLPAPRILVNLLNEGARPAEDVRVVFYMRGSGLLIKLPDKEEESTTVDLGNDAQVEVGVRNSRLVLPRPPAAPKGHWKKVKTFGAMERIASLSEMARSFEPLVSPTYRFPPPILPMTRETDAFYWKVGTRPVHPRHSTELTCQQWRHRSTPQSFEFEVVRFGDTTSRKGAFHVEIHAANLTDPVTKVLPIEIIAKAGDTWAEAEALIELLSQPSGLFRLPRT